MARQGKREKLHCETGLNVGRHQTSGGEAFDGGHTVYETSDRRILPRAIAMREHVGELCRMIADGETEAALTLLYNIYPGTAPHPKTALRLAMLRRAPGQAPLAGWLRDNAEHTISCRQHMREAGSLECVCGLSDLAILP